MATGNDLQALAEQRQAIDKINRLARNGAPNKALQAAYNELMEAVQKGNEKAIEKAVEVAVNENPAMLPNVSPELRWREHGLMAS